MKLAEALMIRSEYQKKIDGLQQRILANLKVQENEKPNEDPNALIAESMKLSDELCAVIKKINKKNNEITLADGKTIADALAERDMLLKKRNLLNAAASAAGQRDYRLTHAEVKMYAAIDIGGTQKEIDSISRSCRQLDIQIQEKNWSVELE